MDESIVTFFGSFAAVMALFAIILGLGRKYHYEDLKKDRTKDE